MNVNFLLTICCKIASFLKIGPLHDPVTWYEMNLAGTQITLWDFQNKGLRPQINSILRIIIWPGLTRTGNYQIHEFDWLKWILTAV